MVMVLEMVVPLQLQWQLHHQVFPLVCLQELQQVCGQVLHACMFRNALSKKTMQAEDKSEMKRGRKMEIYCCTMHIPMQHTQVRLKMMMLKT